jgi:hypothetical protein
MLKRNTSIRLFSRKTGLSMDRPQASALLLVLFSLVGAARISHAQAIPASQKSGQINVFGTYTFTSPDYGSQNNNGFTVGGNYMLRRFIFGQPGIAARYSRTTGSTVNERFGGAGLEDHFRFAFLRPYATILYGIGSLDVPANHYSDSGNELLIGGGADVPLSRRFAARGEFTYGFLHIAGLNGTPLGEINLTPKSVNVGIVYHIR